MKILKYWTAEEFEVSSYKHNLSKRDYLRRRRKEDILFRISEILRSSIRKYLVIALVSIFMSGFGVGLLIGLMF
jgi:hypothetical protein